MTKAEQEFNQCIKEVAEFIKEIDKMLLEDRLFYFPDFILWGRN